MSWLGGARTYGGAPGGPVTWATNGAGDVGGWDPLDFGRHFDGGIDPASEWLVGNWEDEAHPERTKEFYNKGWQRVLAREATPSADNPMLRRAYTSAEGAYRRAGYNPAAAAAGATRVRTRGWLALAPMATRYRGQLQTLAGKLENTQNSVPTTTRQNAFLGGFFGGGGGGGGGGGLPGLVGGGGLF